MKQYIDFSVHRNPKPDAEGNDTYQVRQETRGVIDKEQLLQHLRETNLMKPELMEMALSVLERVIVDYMVHNHRVHIDGLGSFYLKLGFRERYDEQWNEIKRTFTDPAKITGNDVTIESIGFTPDKAFLKLLNHHNCHFQNVTGRGRVGHSVTYTEEEMKARLDEFFKTHDFITGKEMQQYFGLTRYMAQKWLEQLSTAPERYLTVRKIGSTLPYHRT